VKGKCPGNRYPETFTLFVGAIDEFPDSLNGKNRPLLKSLVTENFQLYEIPKTECGEVYLGFFSLHS
jgi:hypothetical protein